MTTSYTPHVWSTGDLVTASDANHWETQYAAAMADVASDLVFPGLIVETGRSTAPNAQWLLCDGSAVSRATYAALFAAIGTTYGAGNGVTTFNIPDRRGRFGLGKAAAGTGSVLGATGGALDHTHTGPSHTHQYTDIVQHTHGVNITDGGHNHLQNAHSHGVTDGGHVHPNSVTEWDGGVTATPGGEAGNFRTTASTPNAVTGITINNATATNIANTTGITATTSDPGGSVATGTTQASGTGATGSNNPAFVVVNYLIKT